MTNAFITCKEFTSKNSVKYNMLEYSYFFFFHFYKTESNIMLCHTFFLLVCGLTALVGIGLLTAQVLRSHTDTPHSVGLLWMSDRPVAETSYLTTHNTQKRHGGIQNVATQPWCSIMFKGHSVSCNHIHMIRT
jgi:hypothetical protein